MRILLSFVAILVLLATGLAGSSSAPAVADPPTSFRQLAINVPGSLLSAASLTAEGAGGLASAQTFDWGFTDPVFASVSGTITPTPVSPPTTLTPQELAAWEKLIADFGGPATKASSVTKVVGAVSLPLLGFSIGTRMGAGAAHFFGFNDDQVCAQQDVTLEILSSVLDGVDCSAYRSAMTELQQNLDQQEIAVPKTSCVETYCLELLGTVPWAGQSSYKQYCFAGSGTIPAWGQYGPWATVTMTDNTFASTGDSVQGNMACESRFPGFAAVAWAVPVEKTAASWSMAIADSSMTSQRSAVQTYDPSDFTRDDPDRQWQCEITTTSNQSYTAASDVFKEGDGTFAGIRCPTLPAGKVAAYIEIREVGGGSSRLVLAQDVTGAYADWAANFPECANGSCLLDLRKDNASCFDDATSASCDGWMDNPSRDSHFTCVYGTHLLDLSECYVYAPTFSAPEVEAGHGYADPATGDILETQTTPIEVDYLTRSLLESGLESWQTPKFALGNVDEVLATGTQGDVARLVAQQCFVLGVEDECESRPIFSPGINLGQATEHDLNAILVGGSTTSPQPAVLNRTPPENRAPVGWYKSTTPCNEPYESNENCDEYPFRSTAEGGPGSSLRVIPFEENTSEGFYLGHFYNVCGVNYVQSEFVVVPLTTVWTSQWCN